MHAPLAHHLTRFSRAAPAGASIVPPPPVPVVLEVAEPSVTMTVAALEARLEEATGRLRAELEADHAAERARVDALHAETLTAAVAAASSKSDGEEGERIAAQLRAALDTLGATMCDTLATALRPLFADVVAARAAGELVHSLQAILADPDHPILTVRGPSVRLSAVQAALGDGAALAFVADEGVDEIVVTGHGVRLETRLAQAMAILSESV